LLLFTGLENALDEKPRQKNEGQKGGLGPHATEIDDDEMAQTVSTFLSSLSLSAEILCIVE
jgi:hypothetical protein